MYVECADINADCARAREAGATVLEGVVDRPWGQQEFVVEDPDGFWWTFWPARPLGKRWSMHGRSPRAFTMPGPTAR